MNCYKCRQEIPDNAKFCSHCGAEMNGKKKKSGCLKWLVWCVVLFFVAVFALGGEESEAESTTTETATMTMSTDLLSGWYQEEGKTYYLNEDSYYVGVWEIDGDYYCFDDDGVMLTNKTYEDEKGYKLELDSQGKAVAICYPQASGSWSEEMYSYGYNGRCHIMEFSEPIEGVISTTFYVEAEGNYGSNMDGKWRVYFRINGQWQEQPTLSVSDGSGTVTVSFETPVDIEAITAHPTKQGNASYLSYYELHDTWCELD